MTWLPNRLGSYEVLRRIGEGGMATAFLGRSPEGREVVLKVPLEPTADMTIKLRDEAQAGFRIRHPHVVETIDFLLDQGRPILVIDYINGCALRDLRQLGGQPNPLPAAAVAWLGRALAEGLAAIHEATDEEGRPLRMLHRDVTPSNILIGTDGVPKLIDLGIARSAENQQEQTQVGMLKGTLRYVAPELLAGDNYSAATDLWSLGVCLFEAALGRQMVTGDPVAIFRALTAGSYRTLREGEVLHPDLAAAIFALVTDKNTRLRNARAAAAVFGRLEQRLVSEDPQRYSGQAWLQSWVPYASDNEADEDGQVVAAAGAAVPTAGPTAAPVAKVTGDVLITDDLDVAVDDDVDVFAASTDVARVARAPASVSDEIPHPGMAPASPASSSSSSSSSFRAAPSAMPQPIVRTVVGDERFGTTPTLAMPAAQIAPPAAEPAATLVLPRVDVKPAGPADPASTLVLPRVDLQPAGAATLVLPQMDALPPGGPGPTLVLPAVNVELQVPSPAALATPGRPAPVIGPTLVLPRVDLRPTNAPGPTLQMPAAHMPAPMPSPMPAAPTVDVVGAGPTLQMPAAWVPAAVRPRLVDEEQAMPPATGDVLPDGASTIQMATWTPPGPAQPEPESWDDETFDKAVPRYVSVVSGAPVVSPETAPLSDVAKPTMVMPVSAIPARPTTAEAAATIVMGAVDIPLAVQPAAPPRPTTTEAAATIVMGAVDIPLPEPNRG